MLPRCTQVKIALPQHFVAAYEVVDFIGFSRRMAQIRVNGVMHFRAGVSDKMQKKWEHRLWCSHFLEKRGG